MNLVTLVEEFGSDDRCRARLEKLRWPDGVECPRCNSKRIARRKNRTKARHQLQCKSCRYDFSVTSGTIFHDSHLSLWKWFLAVYLIVESKKGISANQLKRSLGVTYKT
ncbi:MAG TPA: IS1595 family transposase, partial [Rubrobacteraceae bacterium]|nr:IS1595 family transposase [Rubrobacteraceae bacterium]